MEMSELIEEEKVVGAEFSRSFMANEIGPAADAIREKAVQVERRLVAGLKASGPIVHAGELWLVDDFGYPRHFPLGPDASTVEVPGEGG